MLNKEYVQVEIKTSKPAVLFINEDTIQSKDQPIVIEATRRYAPLEITAISDSITKTINLKSKFSSTGLLNIYPLMGLGFIIDFSSDKRYTYPKSIYLDMDDASSNYLLYGVPHKGNVYFRISFPMYNSFLFQPQGWKGLATSNGFWGFGVGLDYYYRDNQFFSLVANVIDDNQTLASVIYEGREDDLYLSAEYVGLSHNHRFNRFSLGYGISYGTNLYVANIIPDLGGGSSANFPIDLRKRYNSFGFLFPAHVQLNTSFNLGLIYRPTFLRSGFSPALKYEHSISVDFTWKIRVRS